MRNNIITAFAGDNLYVKTDSAFQYDHGLVLIIEGVELPTEYDVHFCNTKSSKTKTVTGDANGVLIPDEYLLNGEDVHAYLYLHTTEDDGESVYHIQIPVVSRAAIGEEDITPIEHDVIKEALEALAEAVEETGENVTHYPYINEDKYWMVYDAPTGEFINTGIKAEGDIDPADVIDDTAGSGNTTRAWSADKITGELDNKADITTVAPDFEDMVRPCPRYTYCSHEGKLYIAITNITGEEEWTPSHWLETQATVLLPELANTLPFVIQAVQDVQRTKIDEPDNEGTNGQVLTTDGNGGRSWTTVQSGGGTVTDVQIDGTSILSQGVANIPLASGNDIGTVKVASGGAYGLQMVASGTTVAVYPAQSNEIKKPGTSHAYHPITATHQHEATFYGLAKAAGDSTQSSSSNAVGTYTDEAKAAIQDMLDVPSATDAAISNSVTIGVRPQIGAVGINSIAIGNAIASGDHSIAICNSATASGFGSVSRGMLTQASGMYSQASGALVASTAILSHAEGMMTIANGAYSHVFGVANVPDSWPAWQPNTSYHVGDKVSRVEIAPAGLTPNASTTVTMTYICIADNSDAEFTPAHWEAKAGMMDYVEIVGNGESLNNTSNARALDWDGNEYLNGNLYVNCNSDSTGGTMVLTDVQVNGTSVVSNGVANVPQASTSDYGVVKIGSGFGLKIGSNNTIMTDPATVSNIKNGTDGYKPVCSGTSTPATFYGLAKAAGDTTQKSSSNDVGVYTENALSKISEMLNAPVSVSGSTPSITAMSGVRYICGECSTLSITAPASGCIDVTFTSGSTATVLTVTPPTGVAEILWANGFDPDNLDADTVYEINILDGKYGVVGTWA